MVDKLAKDIGQLLFPVKLFFLAHSDEVKSVFWSRNGSAVKLNTEILGKECFRPEIFNVADHKHVFRQLSYYGFCRTERKGPIWEFLHPFFVADNINQVKTIKRKGKKNTNVITASDVKKVLNQTRSSSRLQKKVKGYYSSLIEGPELKDEPFAEPLISSQTEGQSRSLRGRRKRDYSHFFDDPILKEEFIFDSLIDSQAKKTTRTSRGRKKCDSASLSKDLVLKKEYISDSFVPPQEKPRNPRGRKKGNLPSFTEDPILKEEPIGNSLITSQTKEPATVRGRRKRGQTSLPEDSFLKKGNILDSVTASQPTKKPRAARSRKKLSPPPFSEDPVWTPKATFEPSIVSQARNNPRGSRSRKKQNVEESSALIQAISLQTPFHHHNHGKDLNLLKMTVKEEYGSRSQTINNKISSVKEKIETEKKKPKRKYVRKKKEGGRKIKEDPSYHAAFQSDVEKCDLTENAFNYGSHNYPQITTCNSINMENNIQNYGQKNEYENNSPNADFRLTAAAASYSEFINYRSMYEDIQSLNVTFDFYQNCDSNVKLDRFVKNEPDVLNNTSSRNPKSLRDVEDVDILTEVPNSLENSEAHESSFKSIATNHTFLQDSSFQQLENTSGSKVVSNLNDVTKGSEMYRRSIAQMKTEQKFENNTNILVPKSPLDLEEVSILFEKPMIPRTRNVHQKLVESIRNEHNYYCTQFTNTAENFAVSSQEESEILNWDSQDPRMQKNPSNEIKKIGCIKTEAENCDLISSDASRSANSDGNCAVSSRNWYSEPWMLENSSNENNDLGHTKIKAENCSLFSSNVSKLPNGAENCAVSSDDWQIPYMTQNTSNKTINLNHAKINDKIGNLGQIKIKEENPGVFSSSASKHFVLGKNYNWEPINENSVRNVSEKNMIHCEKFMLSPLANIPDQLSVSPRESNLNAESDATAYQKERIKSINVEDALTEDSTNNRLPSLKTETEKRRNTVKSRSVAPSSQIGMLDTTFVLDKTNVFSSQPVIPEIAYMEHQNNTCCSQVGMPDTTYVEDRKKVRSNQVGIPDTTYVGHQTGTRSSQVGILDTTYVAHQRSTRSSQIDIPDTTYVSDQANPHSNKVGTPDTSYFAHKNSTRSSEHGMSTYPKLYQDSYFTQADDVPSATMRQCNSHNSQYEMPVYNMQSNSRGKKINTTPYPDFCENQCILSNSSCVETVTATSNASFLQKQSTSVHSKLLKQSTNKTRKKKFKKSKKRVGKLPESKEYTLTSSGTNYVRQSRERNPCQNVQVTNRNIHSSPVTVYGESRNVLTTDVNNVPAERFGTHDDVINSQESDSDIEILDLTDEPFLSDIDEVFERDNDHSKFYVKPEPIEETDFSLPEQLTQQLLEYLYEQYMSGAMTVDDIMCSDNPWIRYHAIDALWYILIVRN